MPNLTDFPPFSIVNVGTQNVQIPITGNGHASTRIDQYAYWHMPLLVLGFVCTDASSSTFCSVLATTLRIYLLEVDLVNIPVPVWVQYITGTGIPFNASTGNVPCRYWYILVQC